MSNTGFAIYVCVLVALLVAAAVLWHVQRPRPSWTWLEVDPVVRVGSARVRSWVDSRGRELPLDRAHEGALVELPDTLVVECNLCGVLHDLGRPTERYQFQLLARLHANEVHDGLVAAEGWAR